MIYLWKKIITWIRNDQILWISNTLFYDLNVQNQGRLWLNYGTFAPQNPLMIMLKWKSATIAFCFGYTSKLKYQVAHTSSLQTKCKSSAPFCVSCQSFQSNTIASKEESNTIRHHLSLYVNTFHLNIF